MAMRNNEDRLGVVDSGENSPATVVADTTENTSATSFNFVTPTEFVDLPSKGRFYPEGHVLHNTDSVEIKYMTAKEEDILTSKSLLKKGKAIDRFLKSVVVDKRINIDDFMVGDKAALLVAARATGYGTDYNTSVVCPNCAERGDWSFDLTEAAVVGPDNIHSDASLTENNTIVVRLPKLGVDVECRFLNGHDEKMLAKAAEMKKKNRLQETQLTDLFRSFIVSVNGNTDKNIINQLIFNMPALDSRHLRTVYSESTPNIDLTQEFNCNNCGYEGSMEVPFTTDFLWPKR